MKMMTTTFNPLRTLTRYIKKVMPQTQCLDQTDLATMHRHKSMKSPDHAKLVGRVGHVFSLYNFLGR